MTTKTKYLNLLPWRWGYLSKYYDKLKKKKEAFFLVLSQTEYYITEINIPGFQNPSLDKTHYKYENLNRIRILR